MTLPLRLQISCFQLAAAHTVAKIIKAYVWPTVSRSVGTNSTANRTGISVSFYPWHCGGVFTFELQNNCTTWNLRWTIGVATRRGLWSLPWHILVVLLPLDLMNFLLVVQRRWGRSPVSKNNQHNALRLAETTGAALFISAASDDWLPLQQSQISTGTAWEQKNLQPVHRSNVLNFGLFIRGDAKKKPGDWEHCVRSEDIGNHHWQTRWTAQHAFAISWWEWGVALHQRCGGCLFAGRLQLDPSTPGHPAVCAVAYRLVRKKDADLH